MAHVVSHQSESPLKPSFAWFGEFPHFIPRTSAASTCGALVRALRHCLRMTASENPASLHVPFTGSILGLYLGLFCFLLSTVGIGLMISSLAVTKQQGLLGVFLFMVPAIVLSGFATPIANMPRAVQYITLLDPLRYFLIILRGNFLEGAGVSLFWPQYWPLVTIGVVSLVVAGRLFRRLS